ncbi:MAG: hypothetical protein ACTSU2_11570 [Promethearchaeota archaeon]
MQNAAPGNFENQIYQNLQAINQYLDGTIAQINAIAQKIDAMGKTFAENIVNISENMRLIVEVVKTGRIHINDTINELSKQIENELKKLWEEKKLESITEDELKAIEKLKEINSVVADNLYMTQLLAIIQSIREMIGRALAIKMKQDKAKSLE